MVITIDGPAGAGKSTVARLLAARLGFEFLDTGAMYRCVTLAALRAGIPLEDSQRVAELAEGLQIELDGDRVLLNGEDVSAEIRLPEVSANIGKIADNLAVRRHLTQLQRRWAQGKRVVTEGRDQGTEVFPDAACKFFLTASRQERARRRHRELLSRGIEITFEEVLEQQDRRDREDAARPIGALRPAPDAIQVDTDGHTLEEVTEILVRHVRQKLSQLDPDQPQPRQDRPTPPGQEDGA
ncbi:MAG: (d)CMP kinase [Planctomycetota bacterium]|nr:MAG: (d)CMP kinase [Planctomycetota bacterium]